MIVFLTNCLTYICFYSPLRARHVAELGLAKEDRQRREAGRYAGGEV